MSAEATETGRVILTRQHQMGHSEEPMSPTSPTRYALEGRVVTMNDTFDIFERAVIYIEGNRIVAICPPGQPIPDGFAGVPVLASGGTIYPGLIDLHNHLAYNVLPLWDVPTAYGNRDEWARDPDYLRRVSKAMLVLALQPELLGPIARYAESKCLLSGVTTTQGMRFKKKALEKYFDGLIRNVEQPGAGTGLPGARTQVADVPPAQAAEFLTKLQSSSCFLLHLCEGIGETTRRHFTALQLADDEWAITGALAGIHSICLTLDDLRVMQERGAAVVWSPLSNLLLYGQTINLAAVKASGVRIALGSDWSPSGSKNLLGELKVARLVSEAQGGIFGDRELLAMATRGAAAILGWQDQVGVLQAGALADMVVLVGRQGDPYEAFLTGRESTVSLVIIDGVPRAGQTRLMKHFGSVGDTEEWQLGRATRLLNFKESDPIVGELSLREARDRLEEALHNLPHLAEQLMMSPLSSEALEEQWTLVLDIEAHDETSPDALFFAAPGEGSLAAIMDALPTAEEVAAAELDALTMVDDRAFFRRLKNQPNVPEFVKIGLPGLY
jgi:5-methylthioadenosine/S-adenosylhomocysteine deaminase